MEIELKGTGESENNSSDISTKTFAYSVDPESDFLIVFFECGNDPGAFTVATYNAVAMTEIEPVQYVNPDRFGAWYLANPTTGSNNVVLTWTNALRCWITVADFKGVHSGNPIYAEQRSGGTGLTGGASIATLPLGYTIEMMSKSHTDWDNMAPTGGQTFYEDMNTSVGGRIVSSRLALLDADGYTSRNLTWSWSVSRKWHQLSYSLRNRVPINQMIMVG
jgi:hypothetical protein